MQKAMMMDSSFEKCLGCLYSLFLHYEDNEWIHPYSKNSL